MGATFTRRRSGGEESGEMSSQSVYRYPPKTGSYFGTHFIMGGERFESPQPGEYLFGDSEELNFLGNKPVPFPYPVPTGNEPTKTLKSLVYIRKDSLRLVKATTTDKVDGSADSVGNPYNIEFVLDSDVRCAIRIHYFAAEEIVGGQIVYHPKENAMSSETYHYKRGAGQSFSQASHTVDPSRFSEEEWQYSFDKEVYPIVIHCAVEEEEHVGHAHITYAVIEKSQEGSYAIKPLKQKQVVDGLSYLLQEIYGIENKNMERLKDVDPDDEVEDSGAECVICMSDMRDTLILPCRHLCLCSNCADSLRYQASMCPICRVKFRALLQIRAMRKKAVPTSTNPPQSETEDNPVNQEGVPQGYEAISLIEALNGQVVPPISNEGVHLQISGPPTVFSVEKKGQKETKVTVPGPIEYQKEMDTDKESNRGTLEKKKDKDKTVDTTDVTSTEAASDATPDEVVPRPIVKEVNPSPLKSTVVTVRCSPDGSMTTETKISTVRETELLPTAPPMNRRLHERNYKTNINVGRLTCGLSTGDMADDEREDSSEPEPDYDDRDSDDPGTTTTTNSNQDLYGAASVSGSLSELLNSAPVVTQRQYESDSAHSPIGYSSLQVSFPDTLHSSLPDTLQVALPDNNTSSTEGSSFGSNCSAHALLTPAERQRATAATDVKSGDDEPHV